MRFVIPGSRLGFLVIGFYREIRKKFDTFSSTKFGLHFVIGFCDFHFVEIFS
jgi:hypothetical protein